MFEDDLTNNFLPYEIIEDYFRKKNEGFLEYRNKIIENYYYLAIHEVHKFKSIDNFYSLMEDLIGVSMIGLIKAVDTFDIKLNYKFMTYASICIRNEILLYLRSLRKHNRIICSFDEYINLENDEKEKLTYADMIYDKDYDIYKLYEQKETKEELQKIISLLDDRGRDIINKYFGFDGNPINQTELAKQYNCSQSYMSRLIKKYLEEIKQYNQSLYDKVKTYDKKNN